MKRAFLPLFFAFLIPAVFSCGSIKDYMLTEQDASAAVRQLLQLGAEGNLQGAFTKESVMTAIFPEPMRKALNTLQQLGLTNEVDRFTTTLATAAEESAVKSVPIFVNSIGNMKLSDAMRIVKNGGTAATDYLRSNVGTELRTAIKPTMQQALNQYKLNEQWEKIIQPAKVIVGNKLNLDLPTIMAGMVSEKMFQKLEETEKKVRSDAAARTTPLLQKVFSRNWNQ